MALYEAIKGQTLSINLLEDYRDNGWSITGGKAIHEGCNAGLVRQINVNTTPNVPNKFTYVVSGYKSGSVNIRIENVSGIPRTSNGEFTEILTPNFGDRVYFYSDGNLALESLSISPVKAEGESNAKTFAFDERNKKWIGEFSYHPETMLRFVNLFLTAKNGTLWSHGTNELRNNFYGVQYTSKIIFYVNLSPDEVKNFFSMRQKSNKLWTASNDGDIFIPPSQGKSIGQSSRLKSSRFKKLNNGDWFADFLRDINDTRFINPNEALFKGALLQGNVMKITIENSDTVEVRLLEIDVAVSSQNYTY